MVTIISLDSRRGGGRPRPGGPTVLPTQRSPRDLLALALLAASRTLERQAARLAVAIAHVEPVPPVREFSAGALYEDGVYSGRIDGVTRL